MPRHRARRAALPLLALLLLAAHGERPTGNGDWIGTATSDQAGRITMRLRSVQCDGMVAEGLVTIAPGEADYAGTVRWLGGIEPGETRPIHAKDLEPCPRR